MRLFFFNPEPTKAFIENGAKQVSLFYNYSDFGAIAVILLFKKGMDTNSIY